MEEVCTEMGFVCGSDSASIKVNTDSSNAVLPITIAAKSSPKAILSLAPAQPFPLFSLPLELQRLVIHHYYSPPYSITLESERLSMLRTTYHVNGLPPPTLLLTCRHIHALAAPIRSSLFTGRLILNSVFIIVPLSRQERFAWLRENTRILHFSDSSVHPERWGRYFGVLKGLRRVEIVFPSVIRLDTTSQDSEFCGWKADDMLGKGMVREGVDGWLVGRLDKFRLALVEQLREGNLEIVVTQRYDLGLRTEGARDELVEIDVELAESGAEVVGRRRSTKKQISGELPKKRAEL